ncbi:uncharacterized protein LOC110722991 [Chenopodium quinoa]|uniref:uncharacterized protein LOC110722991 n=1 Tax=Chenopodium quinoa TaxID=63459 RepID=UPI000B78D32E|nr:uncharacterized protein LOC110722991 [Chenopodium quinoa]
MDGHEVVRLMTEKPPAHCILKIESFSVFQDASIYKCNEASFKSIAFGTGGYTWVLSVFPKGNKQEHVDDHLSVYVTLVDKLAPDAREKRFHYLKNTWGVSKFLPISTFNDPENGFLVDDYCVFGAEVFVLKNQAKISTMSIPEEDCVRSYTWRIKNFTLTTAPTNLYSPLDSSSGLNYGNKLYVEYFLKLKNQREGENHQKLCYQWFSASENRCGSSAFLSINDLLYSSKGYLVSNTLIVEVCVEKMFLLKD